MADTLTKKQRSACMSHIRSRGNKATELALAGFFRCNHISGWRRRQTVFGHPDFVFHNLKLAIFVDGCFWHRCPGHFSLPESNRRFWCRKIEANQTRDRLVNRVLRRQGWMVLRIWQHELSLKNKDKLLRRVQNAMAAAEQAG